MYDMKYNAAIQNNNIYLVSEKMLSWKKVIKKYGWQHFYQKEKKCVSACVEKKVYKNMHHAVIVIISGITALQKSFTYDFI